MRHLIVTAGFLFLCAPGIALAQPAGQASPEAKEHFDLGTRHFNIQEWADAIKEYKTAYKLDPRPEFLWALGQAQRQSGDCEAAIKSYQALLRSSSSPQRIEAISELIARCQATLAESRAAPPTEPKPAPPAEPEATIPAAPRSAPPPAAEAVAPTSAPTVLAVVATPPGWSTDVLGHALFFGGTAIAAAGGIALALGNGHIADANGATAYASFQTSRAAGLATQRWGVIGLSAGGALAAAGVVRFVVVAGRRGGDDKAAAFVGPYGLGVGITGRF